MFRMTDEKGPDDKIIAVPAGDPRQEHLQDLRHLPEFERLEIQHFFEVYKDLEPGKSVEGATWAGRDAAELEIEEARRRAAHSALRRQPEPSAGQPAGARGRQATACGGFSRLSGSRARHAASAGPGLGEQVVAGRSQMHAVGVADLLERPVDHQVLGEAAGLGRENACRPGSTSRPDGRPPAWRRPCSPACGKPPGTVEPGPIGGSPTHMTRAPAAVASSMTSATRAV